VPANKPLAALAVLAALAIARPAGTRDLPLPGPAPRPPLEPIAGMGAPYDERCATCHEEIAAEWRGSLHHASWQNRYFERAYARERTPFCRKCHAPSADPANEPPREAREAGVGCTTCHVVPAGVVGARGMPTREKAHAVIGDARLATPAACGNCHDFAFPGPPGVTTGPMQDTLGEHRRSAFAATPCQGCHMPEVRSKDGGKHRSHAFRVQGDRAMMARAVEVRAAELRRGEVRLTIAPGAIGHAFPTGDLYRRAEVRVAPIDAEGHVLTAGSSEVLGRIFAPRRGPHDVVVQTERSDTRLAGPREIVLAVPPATRRARWQIVWQRLPPWLAGELELKMVEHEVVVLEGVVTR
jgi:hypothetical protein